MASCGCACPLLLRMMILDGVAQEMWMYAGVALGIKVSANTDSLFALRVDWKIVLERLQLFLFFGGPPKVPRAALATHLQRNARPSKLALAPIFNAT